MKYAVYITLVETFHGTSLHLFTTRYLLVFLVFIEKDD